MQSTRMFSDEKTIFITESTEKPTVLFCGCGVTIKHSFGVEQEGNMADVMQRNNREHTRFIALSREAKLAFVEQFGDDVVVQRTVAMEHGPELAEDIKSWGLTIE